MWRGKRGWVARCLAPLSFLTMASSVACSTSTSPVEATGDASSALIEDGCARDEDCVSGICRAGTCAVCNTLTFDSDTAEHALPHGRSLENAYTPAHLSVKRKHGKRGLGVAYRVGSGAQANNVLISQAEFTEQEILAEQVARPKLDSSSATLELQFPSPVCLASYLEVNLKSGRVEAGSLQRCASTCASDRRRDSSTLKLPIDAGDGLDSVKVCRQGSAPLGSGSHLGLECGVEVVGGGGEPVVDPCADGTEIGSLRLSRGQRTRTLPLALVQASSLCIKVEGDRSRLKAVELDGVKLEHGGRAPIRAVVAPGSHSLSVKGHADCQGAQVRVYAVPGFFDPRSVVARDGLELRAADEVPDVVPRPGSTTLSAAVSVDQQVRCDDGLSLDYEFRIYSPSTCAIVRSLRGTAKANAGATSTISAQWDGKDAAGQLVPDGDYLWTVEVALERHAGHGGRRKTSKVSKLTAPFRRVRVWGAVGVEECRDAVRTAIAASGIANPDERFDVVRNMLRCGADTPSACEIDYFTLVNLQRRESANAILEDRVSPAQYLALQYDRSRKVRRADNDRGWLAAFCAGDDDRDLVPDAFDRCPQTPPLTPTDDHGCTDNTLPEAPDRDEVRRMFGGMKVAAAPDCPRDALPRSSAVLLASQPPNRALHVALRRETRMPEGCPVWYELRGTATAAAGTSSARYVVEQSIVAIVGPGMVPSAMDATTIDYDITPEALGFAEYADDEFFEWQELNVSVRTIIGNGHRSADGAMNRIFVQN